MSFLPVYAFVVSVVLAGALDVVTLRIPNWLIVAQVLLFVPAVVVTAMPPFAIWLHFATGASLLIAGYCLFAFGLVGGGDAKLLAAIGLWLGFPVVLPFLLFSALAGGVLALAMAIWTLVTLEMGARRSGIGAVLGSFLPSLPYGFALASGAILAMPYSWWMATATG